MPRSILWAKAVLDLLQVLNESDRTKSGSSALWFSLAAGESTPESQPRVLALPVICISYFSYSPCLYFNWRIESLCYNVFLRIQMSEHMQVAIDEAFDKIGLRTKYNFSFFDVNRVKEMQTE